MAREKSALHGESTPGRTVGWLVLIAGVITLLYGAGRLLFVVSYGFVAEETVESFGYDPACVETAADLTTECAQTYTGTIQLSNGGVRYSTPEEYNGAVELLRAGQRVKSGLILLIGVGISATGMALLAISHHSAKPSSKRTTSHTKRRKS